MSKKITYYIDSLDYTLATNTDAENTYINLQDWWDSYEFKRLHSYIKNHFAVNTSIKKDTHEDEEML